MKNSFITTYGYEKVDGETVVKYVKLGKASAKVLKTENSFVPNKPLETKVDQGAKKIADSLNDTSLSLDRLTVKNF